MISASPTALLDDAVRAFAGADIDVLSDDALGADLVAMRRAMDLLEAEFSRRLARFDAHDGHAVNGCLSAVAWLRTHCRMSTGDAMQRVELERRLPSIEGAEAAFRSGEIAYRNATILARAAAEIGAERIAPSAQALLDYARVADPYRLRLATRHARHVADPDGTLSDAEKLHENRWLNLSQTLDGVFALDGLLDPEGGSLVRAALEALLTPSRDDDRNAGQRRHDALVELARRQLDGGELPSSGGQRPHLIVTAPAAALSGEAGAPAGELQNGWPVHPETVRRIACDATLTEVTLDAATAEPVSVSRTRHTIPAPIRRALRVRDGGCRFPGCDRPVEWTDAHHIKHRADGGETKVPNLVLLCRRHHRRVHEGRWRLSLAAGGGLVAVPP